MILTLTGLSAPARTPLRTTSPSSGRLTFSLSTLSFGSFFFMAISFLGSCLTPEQSPCRCDFPYFEVSSPWARRMVARHDATPCDAARRSCGAAHTTSVGAMTSDAAAKLELFPRNDRVGWGDGMRPTGGREGACDLLHLVMGGIGGFGPAPAFTFVLVFMACSPSAIA